MTLEQLLSYMSRGKQQLANVLYLTYGTRVSVVGPLSLPTDASQSRLAILRLKPQAGIKLLIDTTCTVLRSSHCLRLLLLAVASSTRLLAVFSRESYICR